MNYYEHHLGDYAKDTAHLSIMEHGAYRLLLDRYYGTEAGIPADQVHRVARARSREEKAAVDAVLMEFFILHDGIWINNRAEREIAKYLENAPRMQEKRENEKERQKRARDKRKAMFKQLNDAGIHMPWNASTEQLQTQLNMMQSRTGNAPVTQPVTRDDTATQSPDPSTHININKSSSNLKSIGDEEKATLPPHRIGQLCIGFRKLGINTSPGVFAHPDWQPILERFDNEFILLVASQRKQSSPDRSFSAAYFLPVLTEIMNSPTKPTNGGLHAERANILEQLTGSNSQPDDDRTIDIESRVVG